MKKLVDIIFLMIILSIVVSATVVQMNFFDNRAEVFEVELFPDVNFTTYLELPIGAAINYQPTITINNSNTSESRDITTYYFNGTYYLTDGISGADITLNGSPAINDTNVTLYGYQSNTAKVPKYDRNQHLTGNLSINVSNKVGGVSSGFFAETTFTDFNGWVTAYVNDTNDTSIEYYFYIVGNLDRDLRLQIDTAASPTEWRWGLEFVGSGTCDENTRKRSGNWTRLEFEINSVDNYTAGYIDGVLCHNYTSHSGLRRYGLFNTLGAGAGDVHIDDIRITNRSINPYLRNINDLVIYTGGDVTHNTTGILPDSFSPVLDRSQLNTIFKDCTCSNCIAYGNDSCGYPWDFILGEQKLVQFSNFNLTYGIGIDNCSDFNYTVFNVSFLDQATQSPLSTNVDYDFTLPDFNDFKYNGSVTGQTTIQFCSYANPLFNNISIDLTGQIIASATNYETQTYTFDPSLPKTLTNNPRSNLSIYLSLLNETTTVSYTWQTVSFQPIDGVMRVYECQGSTKTLIASNPISNGLANANIELLTKAYSYEVVTGGQVYTEDPGFSQCHVESQTEISYYVDTEGVDTSPYIGFNAISCNVTQTGDNTVLVEWGTNPHDSSVITGCIRAHRQTLQGMLLIYENCSTVSPIERTVPDNLNNYVVGGKLFQSGLSKECREQVEFIQMTDTSDSLGVTGVFAVVLLITAGAMLYIGSGAALVGAGVAVIGAFVIGLTAFKWTTVAAMIFFLVIIGIVGRTTKNE